MQFIHKQPEEPKEWDEWFSKVNGSRSHDYKKDYGELTNLSKAKHFLLEEQHWLCAYCQKSLEQNTSSFEHIIPKSFNKDISTNYYNLVLVCKKPLQDINGRTHCDKEREDKLLIPLIFYDNAQVKDNKNHNFLVASHNGQIRVKESLKPEIENQVQAFIDILNLNHSSLKKQRHDSISGILDIFYQIPKLQKNEFLLAQKRRLMKDTKHPFRQFLLIYLSTKLGIN